MFTTAFPPSVLSVASFIIQEKSFKDEVLGTLQAENLHAIMPFVQERLSEPFALKLIAKGIGR